MADGEPGEEQENWNQPLGWDRAQGQGLILLDIPGGLLLVKHILCAALSEFWTRVLVESKMSHTQPKSPNGPMVTVGPAGDHGRGE